MRALLPPSTFLVPVLLALASLAGGADVFAAGSSSATESMPLISRGVPAYASSQGNPARNADDGDYSTFWSGAIPSWLAYDLSRVPSARRGKVLVAWYNDPQTTPYDRALVGDKGYNDLRAYTIEASRAPGRRSPPSSGWMTLVTVTGNGYHSRQHLLDLTGYNWIRIDITAGDGSPGNTNASINFDVHDASGGASDSWIFYGDSITEDGLHHEPIDGVGNLSQLVHAAQPAFYPAYEDGGSFGIGAQDGARRIATWLAVFPGRYVGLAFGTNDANGCGNASAFYKNYVAMVRAVLDAGKIPIVPTIPWARTASVRQCGPRFNARIEALYAAFPQIVRGPDLWSYYRANPNLISGDDLHPSTEGYVAYRRVWANAMLAQLRQNSRATKR